MAIRDQYINTEEMVEIITICNKLNELNKNLAEHANVATEILYDSEGLGRTFKVYDSNGEVLGHIGRGDSGYVLYFDDGVE